MIHQRKVIQRKVIPKEITCHLSTTQATIPTKLTLAKYYT
jgi:hypothetical protein